MLNVSIVTYNTRLDELEMCLNSLSSAVVDKIFVIDNSSKDYLANFCKGKEKVEYQASKNVGYGTAHNKAIRKSIALGTKYHLVLNSDVYFEPEALIQLVAYMDEREDVAMVQPNIVYPDRSLQYTCRLLPTPANLIFRRFMPAKMAESMNYKYLLKMFNHKKELNVPYHQGSFLFFRTSCLKKVGLFDERFFMYPEDIDITRRMHREYRTMFWPSITVIHAHRAASYKSKKMLFIHIWNMIKYFNKWGWINDRERKEWNRQLLENLCNNVDR